MSIVRWLGFGLESPCILRTLTQSPPVAVDRTSTSPTSDRLFTYQRKYWSKSRVTDVAPSKLMNGVSSCSSWVAPVSPAASLSTLTTGAAIGASIERPPGLAAVHVAAAPPPKPP